MNREEWLWILLFAVFVLLLLYLVGTLQGR